MTLIDTSAWIEFLRKSGDMPTKQRVDQYVTLGEAAYTCPVYLELIAGARKHETPLVQEGLSLCHRFLFEPQFWDSAAGLYRKLRSGGITVPWLDVLIAVVAIEQRLPLLCRDRHFDLIREAAGSALQLEQLA